MCHNCHNTQDHKDLVTQTIAYTRSRNPASFEAKVRRPFQFRWNLTHVHSEVMQGTSCSSLYDMPMPLDCHQSVCSLLKTRPARQHTGVLHASRPASGVYLTL